MVGLIEQASEHKNAAHFFEQQQQQQASFLYITPWTSPPSFSDQPCNAREQREGLARSVEEDKDRRSVYCCRFAPAYPHLPKLFPCESNRPVLLDLLLDNNPLTEMEQGNLLVAVPHALGLILLGGTVYERQRNPNRGRFRLLDRGCFLGDRRRNGLGNQVGRTSRGTWAGGEEVPVR